MIFKYTDYRHCIRSWLKERKARGQELTYQSLANVMRIQKSYLSRVMKGRANLNSDQAYLLARYMNLSNDEQNYFLLLIEWARSGVSERRQDLHEQILEIQRIKVSTDIALNKSEAKSESLQSYYLNPLSQILHIALSGAANSPQELREKAQQYKIDEGEFFHVVDSLVSQGLLQVEKGRFINKAPQLHLKRGDPITQVNHVLHRAFALTRLLSSDFERNYTFTATFSADETTFTTIKVAFMEFLKAIEEPVEKAPAHLSYQMNFDLFPWFKN